MHASRDEVEGDDRERREEGFHIRFPPGLQCLARGSMDPMKELGGGDGGKSEIRVPVLRQNGIEVELSSLHRNQDTRVDQRSQGDSGGPG